MAKHERDRFVDVPVKESNTKNLLRRVILSFKPKVVLSPIAASPGKQSVVL